MDVALALGLSLTAALLLAVLVTWQARLDADTLAAFAWLYTWGALIATFGTLGMHGILETMLETLIPGDVPIWEGLSATVLAPFVEEVAKGLALVTLCLAVGYRYESFADGVLHGALVGLGFETTENFFYMMGALADAGLAGLLPMAFARLSFGFTHALFTAFTGVAVAGWCMYHAGGWGWLLLPLGWLMGVLAHAAHNFTAMTTGCCCVFGADGLAVMVFVGVWRWAQDLERNWLRKYLWEEVERGVISVEHYRAMLTSKRRRHWLGMARDEEHRAEMRRFFHKMKALALAKAHAARDPRNASLQKRVAQLRREVARLARRVGSFADDADALTH